jgi:predicted short-subunit dehydrogenase-like oxidoreductase (DUF2520 family)
MRRLSFFLVGPGAVGLTFASALIRAGHRCVGVEGSSSSHAARARRLLRVPTSGKTPRGRTFDLLVLAIPDARIDAVARAWAGRVSWRGKFAFHTSGALSSSELKPLARRGAFVASVHPLTSLPKPHAGKDAFRGVSFGLEGNLRACSLAASLVREMKGHVLRIPRRSKAAYHLGACLASGYLLTLLSIASELMERRAGIGREPSRRALLRLAAGSVENASRLGLASSLTGPLVRGDLVTLRRHFGVLRRSPRDLKALHDILATRMLEILLQEGRIRDRNAAELLRLFGSRRRTQRDGPR